MELLKLRYRDTLDAIMNPRFRKNDLVIMHMVSVPAHKGHVQTKLGLVATEPSLARSGHNGINISYGVIDFETDGQTIWLDEGQLILQQKYACVQDS